MKRKIVMAAALVALLASATGAFEWSNKIGLGVRGPVFSPMFKGSSYSNFQGSYEPFMMGWNGVFEIKYGAPKNLIIDLSIATASTYDDTTARTDQAFKMNKKDRAYSHLTGLLVGLTCQYYFLPDGNVQPYLLGGFGLDYWTMKTLVAYESTPKDSKYKFGDLGVKAGAGINFWLTDNLSLDLQGKLSYGISKLSTSGPVTAYGDLSSTKNRPFNGYITPSIGITYFLGGSADQDKDGVKDKYDQCPDTPLGAIVDQYGCPLDSDGDGVYDGIDQCPDTPKGCIVDITGCPLDTDKDGVCDGLDKCPDTPAGVKVDVHGCPLDTDGDGVPDYKDKQPDTPKGAVVDADGVAIDSDHDGVPDGIDKCPDTPAGIAVDEFGCPKAKPLTTKVTLNIQYQTGSFDPDTTSRNNLDEIANTMQAYPNLKIQVNGFTDALGSDSGNLKLSQKRANVVKDYLVSKGISAERITSQGYGEQNPIADNGTQEGRAKNRRIEIVPVE